jgi:hypothetical protein
MLIFIGGFALKTISSRFPLPNFTRNASARYLARKCNVARILPKFHADVNKNSQKRAFNTAVCGRWTGMSRLSGEAKYLLAEGTGRLLQREDVVQISQ